ncbi:MAG: A24 family peptidase C-terminal domain-containing protein [Candidatus Bathyarchaeia archaeon]
MQTLTLARTIITLFFLSYASWSDYKTREVSNSLWILFAPPALALSLIELFLYEPMLLLPYVICFGLTSAFAITLFYLGAFGGADAKALMCLALALPFYPKNLSTPIAYEVSPISQFFFPITVFSNSVLFAAAAAIYLFFRNVLSAYKTGTKLFEEDFRDESRWKKLLVLMTGYKVSLEKLRDKWHLYPLEDVKTYSESELKRILILMPRDEERNGIVDRLTEASRKGKIQNFIWATPGLPMLIFTTMGLIAALFFGDIVWAFIRFLLE